MTSERRINRRNYLQTVMGGLGGVALGWLTDQENATATAARSQQDAFRNPSNEGLHRIVHHPPRAKRVVQLFMAGAASHIDLWDHKPALDRHHGEDSDFGEPVEAFQNGLGPWMKSPFRFRPFGANGKMISEPVFPLGEHIDDIAFIHNMVGKTGVHSQATLLQATGFQRPGFPGMGCWISYALGSLNENLPTFVVLPDHRGYASNGPKNWQPAFLPAQHAGTVIRPNRREPIEYLYPSEEGLHDPDAADAALALLRRMNQRHAESRPDDDRLLARIRSYELAASMQVAAPEALDFSDEPEHILRLYGLDHGQSSFPTEINEVEETEYFGRKCLAARRLLERGVRFVQIWSGNDNSFPRRNWDSHENIMRDHGPLAAGMARGTAGLIADLKQRGMLEDTIVLWTTEFGRMPSTQGQTGRDHNPYVFTNWLCGGGVRGGIEFGPSDQWGYKPLDRERGTTVYDVHATILHLLGIDHEQLTVRQNGIDRRLTDVHGHILEDLIA